MHSSRAVAVISIGALLLVLTACEPARTTSRRDLTAVPSSGVLLGAYVDPVTPDKAGQQAAILGLERSMRRRLALVQWYYPSSSSFPTWREPWSSAGGRRNLISWAGLNSNDINSGRYDALIDQRARGLKALGRPLLFRYMAEMDGSAKRARAVSSVAYVAAWRRIYNRFRAVGARNVEFVWCPNAWGFDAGTAPAWYPGDQYVQWLCADGYNWAPQQVGAKWTSFQQVFQSFYNWAVPRRKPIVIGEFGSVEDPNQPGRKAAWIRDAAATIERWPMVKAAVWFDAKAGASNVPSVKYDWRLRTSSSSLRAWQVAGSRVYLSPK